MIPFLAQDLLAAAPMDDDGLVNLLVTVILVAFWALSAFTKRRSTKASPRDRAPNTNLPQQDTSDLEIAPDRRPEEICTPVRHMRSAPPAPVAAPSATPSATPDRSITSGQRALEDTDLGPPLSHGPGDQPADLAQMTMRPPQGEGSEIVIRMDPDGLREAVVLSEILAGPVSERHSHLAW